MDENAPTEDRLQEIGDQLRSKINSKYPTTAFLGGFGFATLGVQLSVLWQATKVPVFGDNYPSPSCCLI